MHAIAAKAAAFKYAESQEFRDYQKQVILNAQVLAESLKQYGYTIVSGGTDTHLFLVDLRNKNITGKDAEIALAQHEIYVNRNMIPCDTQSPLVTSGIRIGTSFVTAQGKKEGDMVRIAHMIDEALKYG